MKSPVTESPPPEAEKLPITETSSSAASPNLRGDDEEATIAEPNANSVNTVVDDAAEPENEFSVWWADDQDPENPMNWSKSRKLGIIATLSFITFLTPLASSMFAPGIPQVMAEFGESDDSIATFVVSVFVLGFALGPLIISPLSELYGRVYIYHVCNALFVVFSAACGLATNIDMLIAFRFLAGFSGVAVITCGAGSIADMMPVEKRGFYISIWSLGPLLGPVVGPVCAGFLVEAKGWRWVFWIITITSGAVTLASFFVLRESYAPVLLERKAARLRKETGNEKYQSRMKKKGTPRQIFLTAIIRPGRMFFRSAVVMILCLYVAMLYGFLYILFTTFTFVYRDTYGFGSVGAGLSFIGGGVGNILGLAYVGSLSDKIIQRRQAEGKDPKPEDRLHLILTVPSSLTIPIGLMMYGWTADKQLHWILPMIGTGIMGFGSIGILMTINTYLVDAFTLYAASVTAANAVLRSLLGALLPLGGLQLYNKLGLGWGNTLLGLLTLAAAPVPWILYTFGERIRRSPRFRQDF
ncbi:hypothetical protein CABS03_09624 [Colletotrichum abscissum]|uniref:Major facilitator superfamily (MFS) profile domain-containing protein n=2 Tax=Colletotrichum abscissum TaxID=1671311 RepID=A0A9Q0B3Q1_9PEZI|nr:hypothetical protein CABS02_03714 [Colletotrichum abscissum]